MQNVDQLAQNAETLERIFETIAGTIKANNVSRGTRRKLLKCQQALDRASSLLTSIVEDEEPKADKPANEKKAPARKKAGAAAARAHTAHVKRGPSVADNRNPSTRSPSRAPSPFRRPRMTLTYDNEELNVFVRDMESAGYTPRHYRGRSHWTGPAVEVRDLAEWFDVTGLTDVKLQRDELGKGYIVYPVARGKLTSQPEEGESY
jgi:hypothetical protein